ncbi:DUF1127 domain-containing protein [Lichenihabitans sp. Uapishka_5]|uniref:DUF1127 domain-containing protein n=1 Tax=Lichenihabitans sp. Uapishka_5 TaxID=3037302 RepID=UPI0029E7F24B|nr:DUF1127 domain-containing protein [Lichenihabitans sp. Uapishka_5]MDX7951934.1 DUF1127 domain-containing protein [Lichenihabitans sp. Uapishka_5]
MRHCTGNWLATHNRKAQIQSTRLRRIIVVLVRLQTVLKSLRERHQRHLAIRELSALNDHQLADIGVERGSLVDAVNGRAMRSASF